MNNLRKNNKNKSILLNQLKINKNSIKLLGLLNQNKNEFKYKSITSRNNNTNLILNKKFSFSSKFLPSKKNLNKNNTIYIVDNKRNNNKINSIIQNSLTEINPINNFEKKTRNKSRNIKMDLYNNELNYPSNDLTNSRKYYTTNINKYQNIYDKIFKRIKSSYKHNKHFTIKNEFNNSLKKIKVSKTKSSTPIHNKIRDIINNKHSSLPKFEYYKYILEKEFNSKELIKMENTKIKQKLQLLKSNIYSKMPIYKTNEKLNTHLIRQFNLDESDFKNSFNKKYKIYRASVNKIQEVKIKNIFHEFKNNKDLINLENEIFGYSNKEDVIPNKKVKKALNKYYNQKTKKILNKKLEIERELINLKTKFDTEKEKNVIDEYNINYSQLNHIIQTKLIYKEVNETDINKKKQKFYEENTELLHKVRNLSVPSKVVKLVLRQNTINKYKNNIGAYFGSSKRE